MCYAMLCPFQNHMGNCRITPHVRKQIKEFTDLSPCFIGGTGFECKEEELEWQKDADKYLKLQEKILSL